MQLDLCVDVMKIKLWRKKTYKFTCRLPKYWKINFYKLIF